LILTPESLVPLALTVLLLPLAGFLLLIFFGKKMPRQGDWLGLGILVVCLALALTIFFEKLTAFPNPISWNFSWVNFGNVPGFGPLQIVLGLTIDNLTAIMLVVVTLVSTLVHLFSTKYMEGDIRYSRYFAYLSIFTFSMLVIVLTNNFFLIYVGWELVGLSSYLLIGHWYEKKSAADASKKAFVTNRIGDIGMFSGIMILYYTFHTFGFNEIFSAMAQGTIPMGSETWLTAAGILIFCGAVGKSAQFPLHVWLPDAMEGPTPVSALIHAATMVAAGVYLIARAYPIFTADALLVIAYIGAITAFISATIAIAQNDIKKVLAYSTISQLGYMVMGLGVGAYTAGFFHLVTHAMFKAGLFLGSGSIIHAMHHALHHEHDHETDPQDIRNMGGLKAKMPITFYAFLMYTLAISGVPFTSGFLSKDEILAGTLAFGSLTGHYLIPIIGYLVAGLTAFYMFRIVILAFLGEHADAKRYTHIHESPAAMLIPLIVFAVLSFFAFYSFNPFGAPDGWFYHAVVRPESSVPQNVRAAGIEQFEDAVHAAHIPAMALSLCFAGLGILLAFTTYKWKKISADNVAARFSGLHKFLLNKWYFDELYEYVIVGGCKGLANLLNMFDAKVVDGFVNGTATWTMGLVHGSGNAWKEKTAASRIYLYVGLFVAAVVGVATYQWLAPEPAFIAMFRSGIGAMCVGVLTLFFFWKGAGGFDKYVVDGLVNGTAYASGFFGIVFRRLQTGRIQTYIILVVVATMVLFFAFR
jgi:NADH-quinone oxidoreductase subunit L